MRGAPTPALFRARLKRLRAWMREAAIDAVLVPCSDPHQTEQPPPRWQACRWLCGFDGSAGLLIIGRKWAVLWTDSRYRQQAEQRLIGTGVQVAQSGSDLIEESARWLCGNVRAGGFVAIDGDCFSLAAHRRLQAGLAPRHIRLIAETDPLLAVWGDRPGLPRRPIGAGPGSGTAMGRLSALRAALSGTGADSHLISALDDIAWLFDLRGSDIPYHPLFLAHALVEPQRVSLFLAEEALSAECAQRLARHGVAIEPYADARQALARLKDVHLLVDPRQTSIGMLSGLHASVRLIEAGNPVTAMKARKSATEIEAIRSVMLLDGIALCEALAWLDEALREGAVSEREVDRQLAMHRAAGEGFAGASFATIAAFNANAAMPHYRALDEGETIRGDGLLLIDSGGQYRQGATTDVTRMVPVGALTPRQRRDGTLVLKGLIALSRARFPEGMPAQMLDAIARVPLWREGLDYGHGTGHGVGAFLNVHEGPQRISWRAPLYPDSGMHAGMVTSIEPGLYRPGQWGVRIENLVHARYASSEPGFLEFETLTLCPIDVRCLSMEMLDRDEQGWLEEYHRNVGEKLGPHLTERALRWMENAMGLRGKAPKEKPSPGVMLVPEANPAGQQRSVGSADRPAHSTGAGRTAAGKRSAAGR